MPSLGGLPLASVRESLRRGLFRLHIGDIALRVDCNIPEFTNTLAFLYADYEVSLGGGVYDYDVSLHPASWWRRWLRRNVVFGISGQAPFLPMAPSHAHALFEWGLNWAMGSLAHTHLILHSGVVEKNGKGVLLAAESGSGKSTLTAELMLQGWRLFSDELALIDGEAQLVVPMPRPVSLKNQSIDVIQNRHPRAKFGPYAADTHKGTIAHLPAPRESVERAVIGAPAALIVFPKWRADAELRVAPMGQGQAAMRLIDQSFNYPILGRQGFEWLATLVNSAAAWELEYADLDDAVAVLDELLAEHV